LGWFQHYQQIDFGGQPATVGVQVLFPEVALTWMPRGGKWAPYAGAGAGLSLRTGGQAPTGPTLVGRMGVQHALSAKYGLLLGTQYRAITPYGHTVDLTIGLVVFTKD